MLCKRIIRNTIRKTFKKILINNELYFCLKYLLAHKLQNLIDTNIFEGVLVFFFNVSFFLLFQNSRFYYKVEV